MVIAAAASLSLGASQSQLCHVDGSCCSTSYGITSNLIKSASESRRGSDVSCISFRCSNLVFGQRQFHCSSLERDLCLWRVSVAADYSDSLPDSSNYPSYHGYHPLEEVKFSKRVQETQLTDAEIARTTVEANSNVLLVFPGAVHSEPHEQISWAEFSYVVDEYGDIFFEIADDRNILQDPEASNPVNALFGMDIPIYQNKRVAAESDVFSTDTVDNIPFEDDYFEVFDSELSDVPVDWRMPDNSNLVHPIYFTKCLVKASDMEYDRKMDHPVNGVSIIGCLRPTFPDEESYVRWLFHCEDGDDNDSEWKDGELLSFSPQRNRSSPLSTLYRLDIMRIELFSVYGIQTTISVQDFQDAEPDALVHSTSVILEHFREKGIRCNIALKTLCKKKGLYIEGANLIGVDSLGMDVRISSGVEVRTHRFPFKVRATSEAAAEKQIQQLLFPRSHRKKFRSQNTGVKDSKSF